MSGVHLGAWGALRMSLGVVLASIGSILLISAIPAALAASGIESSVGRTGVITQPLGELRAASGDVAVVVDGVDARLVSPEVPTWLADALALAGTDVPRLLDEVGEVSLVASSASGRAFLGVAPAEDVNDYLDGAPYSVATGPADAWPTISVPGSVGPPEPAGEGWWVAQGTGDAPELPGESLGGQTLVLMRADTGPGPEAALRLEYRVPGADQALQSAAVTAAAAAGGGLLLILLGGSLIVGRRRGGSG